MGETLSQHLPDPATAPQLFDQLLRRRVFAYLIDCALIVFMLVAIAVMGAIAGFVTLGLGWLAIPVAVPVAILVYYAITLGSPARATVGMRAMDIVLTPTRGRPLDGWRILAHPLLFWLSCWFVWPVSIPFALFTPRRQMLHDLVCGTLMVRRSPMESHWRMVGAGA